MDRVFKAADRTIDDALEFAQQLADEFSLEPYIDDIVQQRFLCPINIFRSIRPPLPMDLLRLSVRGSSGLVDSQKGYEDITGDLRPNTPAHAEGISRRTGD